MNLREIRKAAGKLGWTEQPTKKGFFFVPKDPTGEKVLVHHNPPEPSLREAVKRMKRQGFKWP